MLISNTEFAFYIFGWICTIISGLMLFITFKFTPASTFMKAWFGKKPIAFVTYRTGMCDFLIGTESAGSMEVKNVGYMQMVEGSHVMDRKSKAPIYNCFAEIGTTIPKFYAPIIQELRELGFIINNFDDYQKLVVLSYSDEAANAHLDSYDNKARKTEYERICNLRKLKIDLKPYKTYKIHELANLFPWNTSPVFINKKIVDAVNRANTKINIMKDLMTYAIAALIIIIGAAIFFKVYKSAEPVVQIVQAGVQTVQTVGSNYTL